MKQNKFIFTLKELLGVIIIIGILITVTTVNLNAIKVKSRDANRIQDIKNVQKALENHYQKYNSYPSPDKCFGLIGEELCSSQLMGDHWIPALDGEPSLPTDPINQLTDDGLYTYIFTRANGTDIEVNKQYYWLLFKLETGDKIDECEGRQGEEWSCLNVQELLR